VEPRARPAATRGQQPCPDTASTTRKTGTSITDEDIRELTGRFEIVYAVGDDPDVIPPPPDAVAGA
jgi:hypothetical protein